MGRIESVARAARVAPPATREQSWTIGSIRPLLGLLALTLLHGCLYLAIVPPWQHYDEPTHFEYVRLIALWNRQPTPGELDRATSREIADSMYRFRFWAPNERPRLFDAAPPHIGFNEKIHPPLYYTLAAVPVRWLLPFGVEVQLYGARAVSVLLYTLVVACAWRITAIITPDRQDIQLAIPLMVILVPAFADQMSAVNNDALVNLATSALLLGCILLIRDGPRPLPLGLVALSLVVGIAAKRTAVANVPLAALAVGWSLQRRPGRWWITPAVVAALGLLVGAAALQYDSAGWSVRPWLADLNRQYLRLSTIGGATASPTPGDYLALLDILFTSFWMRFGWGHIAIGPGWDWAMRVVVLAGVAGLLAAGIRARYLAAALWRRRAIRLFIIAVLLVWSAAVLRFDPQQSDYVPRGRYMHLTIIPTIWLLARGVEELAPRGRRTYGVFALALFFAVLDVAAWMGALSAAYYR